jgi:putative nucleotidyltransferase with HDIG domain
MPRRWQHPVGVAAQAVRLTAAGGFDGDLPVAAAWLHDIGYSSQLRATGFHPIDGARHLRGLVGDERLVNLVAHHSCARIEAPHDELCFCDQTTGPDGEVLDVIQWCDQMIQHPL